MTDSKHTEDADHKVQLHAYLKTFALDADLHSRVTLQLKQGIHKDGTKVTLGVFVITPPAAHEDKWLRVTTREQDQETEGYVSIFQTGIIRGYPLSIRTKYLPGADAKELNVQLHSCILRSQFKMLAETCQMSSSSDESVETNIHKWINSVLRAFIRELDTKGIMYRNSDREREWRTKERSERFLKTRDNLLTVLSQVIDTVPTKDKSS